MDDKALKKISKRMSMLLRHKPERANLTMSSEGWVNLQQFIDNTKITLDTIEWVISTNNKKRFEFNEDKTKIRARQGHSVSVELGYEPIEPPAVLYHGTIEKAVKTILDGGEGLTKMTRHHVHLSRDIETATVVGARRGKPIIFEIDSAGMHKTGYKFYKTDNDVWLTDDVPVRYLSRLDN